MEIFHSKKQTWQLLFSVILILTMLIPGSSAYADDPVPDGTGQPVVENTIEPQIDTSSEVTQVPEDTDIPEPVPTEASPGETTDTMVPESEGTPSPETTPEDQTSGDQQLPDPDGISDSVPEVIDFLEENEMVLSNGYGDPLPMASAAVEAALTFPDPWIVRGGETYRFLPVGGCAAYGGVGTYCTETATPVQAAVDFANPGETVNIGAGVFIETVDITKDLTLQGEAGAIIRAPSGINSVDVEFTSLGGSNIRPIIYVGNGAVVQIDSLTVDGNNVGNTNYGLVGIGYCNASGSISNTTITNIQDNPASGSQHGVGIYVVNKDGVERTVDISNNTINNFQKNAMALSGDGLTVNVDRNTVTGKGEINYIAQNGIQVSYGAAGTITNNTVTGFDFTNPSNAWNNASAGILVYQPGGDVLVDGNTVSNSDNGIYVYDATNTEISSNTVRNNLYGIVLYDVSNTTSTNNVLLDNRTAAIALWDAYTTLLSGDQIDGNSTGTSNNGSSGIYAGDTVNGLSMYGVSITDTYKGLNLDDGASASNWLIRNSLFNGNGYGAFFQGDMTSLVILDSQFNDNATGVMGSSDGVGLYSYSHGADASRIFNNVFISGSQFNGNSYKGLYLEKANDLMIDRVIAQNNGQNGLDINLKGANYSSISVNNSEFSNNGWISSYASGSNIWVKARNDSAYAAYPATLSVLTLNNLNIFSAPIGVIIGNTSADTTGVGNAQLRLSRLVDFSTGIGLLNRSTQPFIAVDNWWGCNTGPNTASPGCSSTMDTSNPTIPTALLIPSYLQLGLFADPDQITNQAPNNVSDLYVDMYGNVNQMPMWGALTWFVPPAITQVSGPGSLSGDTFTAGDAGISTFSTSYDYSGDVTATVETIGVVTPPVDPGDDDPIIIVPVDPGQIIPVTGGLVPLSCEVANLLELPDGRQLIFYDVLCMYSAGIEDEPFETLPEELMEKFPADASFISGVTVSLVKGEEIFIDLPAGVGAAVRFPISKDQTEKQLKLFRWDPFADEGKGEWVEVENTLIEQVNEEDFFFTAPIYKTGTYAMTID